MISEIFSGRCSLTMTQMTLTREVFFSHRGNKKNYPSGKFNITNVQSAASQKHLGLIFDSKLNFNEHIDNKINKCNVVGLMKNQ